MDEYEVSKIQIVAFSTDRNLYPPNYLITEYLKIHKHFIIKKSQQLIAFSTILPNEKRSTKIIVITLLDLELEYEGTNDANCYLIVLELQKDYSKDKFTEILNFIKKNCDKDKMIFI